MAAAAAATAAAAAAAAAAVLVVFRGLLGLGRYTPKHFLEALESFSCAVKLNGIIFSNQVWIGS